MARPAAGTPQHPGADRPDGLLATKLYVPGPQPGFVHRARLREELDEGLTRELVLVCAPAGFGKTALLADWARPRDRPVAWLSLDAGDNDPVRFWRHAAAALDRVQPGIAERVAPLLGPPPPPSFEGVVTALVNELAAQAGGGEVLLVLDDYHLIEAQLVHESLLFLLEHQPPGVHVVLISRADPPLPLARLRARGQLVELRAADLRFTSAEAAELLREAVGPDLPDAAAAALAARTEGWAAGLQLAALSLRAQPDVAGFVATFSGSHRHVLDYLTQEVLERQPPEMREFMLETSVLERLSGALCDAVTGRADGQAMLEAVERANLFLVPLDEVRGWWRYHHLFADLLRARLHQQQPERVAELHRNAGSWHEVHGLPDEAVRHALGAGDPVWAARLIERHIDELLRRGEGGTVRRWLAALPAELAASRPRLLLARAILAGFSGRLEAVEASLDAVERALADAVDEPFEPSVGKEASALANVPAAIATERAYLAQLRGDAEATAAYASRALAELDTGEWMHASIARGHQAVAAWLRGRLGEAERAFTSLIDGWLAAGEPTMITWGCQALGHIQRAQGRLDAALGTCEQTLAVTATPHRPPLPAAGAALVAMADVAFQRGEFDAALRDVTGGIGLCRQLAYTQPLAMGLTTLAWIRQAQGDAAGARDAMGEAGQVALGSEVVDVLNPVPAQRARLLLAQGDVAAAAQWTAERGLGAVDEPDYPREPAYLVLARVLLAQDLPEQALALLERLHTAAAGQGRTGSVIEVQALQALAMAACGEERGAVAALAEALTLAHPQGYVRVFADEGAPMAAALGRLVAAQRTERSMVPGVPLAYLARLARVFEQDDAAAASPGAPHARATRTAVPRLVEPLSEREMEVLRLVAAGKPNREIAEELYVVLDTVKKHVTHILEKLGAANRTEAVARARELGLLP